MTKLNPCRFVTVEPGTSTPIGVCAGVGAAGRPLDDYEWLTPAEATELAFAVLAAVVEHNSIGSHDADTAWDAAVGSPA